MQFLWYWPFAREEELDWAKATARPGESIVVQVVDRAHAPSAGAHGVVTVVRDLPDVAGDVKGLRWMRSRAVTYSARARARRRAWEGADFDLVHLHYLNRFTDAVARLPSPVVISVHDVVPHRARLGPVEHSVLRRTYGRGDALVVHHEALRSQLVRKFDIDPQRIHVVPHQVFRTSHLRAPAGGPSTVLFFGALRHNKGLEVFIDAAERLRGSEIEFVIAGRGARDLEALAIEAATRNPKIRAEIGFVTLERKQELFTNASLVALPYTAFASQSGVLHDAYGHGRPVVVTDVGALGHSVREDGSGLVAAAGDPDDLAVKIVEALEASTWSTLSGATERIRLERSPERTGERLRSVYDLVLRAGAPS
ncbi:glycosyltransferase family 4 protein [Knoellia aerolata]|uniref:glycosyltransferase family 4 protein n=1 Tax=Knoellia aerolata TaxID=442954 RepID=UPI00146FE05E|nr:glycosyltransferase family 4 protein [Knoellia aerolata]